MVSVTIKAYADILSHRRYPIYLAAVPRIGECIESLDGAVVRVSNVIHRYREDDPEPSVLLEVTTLSGNVTQL